MNELTRYRIELGPRCAFDEHMSLNFFDNNYEDNINLLMNLCYEEDSTSEETTYIFKSPEKINVTPNQKLNIYGIYITVPSDASKMIKWSSDQTKSALLFFLKSDSELVDNAFAYQICMDNWIEIEIEIEDNV